MLFEDSFRRCLDQARGFFLSCCWNPQFCSFGSLYISFFFELNLEGDVEHVFWEVLNVLYKGNSL